MSTEVQQTRVQTGGAPAAIGPYSQAVVANGLVFCTGQIALDPETDQLVEGDVQAQTHRVMQNLGAVLEAAGSSLRHVVKTTVFLGHFSDFPAMNDVYEEYFGEAQPARSTVEGGLPGGVLVQIDCIAIVPGLVTSIRVVEARESQSTYDLDLDRDF
jgi:2-iminobutanoate/2-iminopropanoate deaminase